MEMDKDLKTYLLLICLPAVLLAAAGLVLLLFGGRGLADEVKRSGRDEQFERYERNLKSRLSTRARSYAKDREADYVWTAQAAAADTNFSDRVKYGWFPGTNGSVVGWARLDDGTVIGFDEKPFRHKESFDLYILGAAVAIVLLLFVALASGGRRLAVNSRRAREDLETKNSFLDLISHELNTPLGSIVPLSTALASGGIKDEGRRAVAYETLARESSRMARMIGELLTAVRLRNGKFVFARERISLNAIAANAVRLLRCRYPDSVISIAEGPEVFAQGDADKMEQVAINLAENACRYAGDGPILVRCRMFGEKTAVFEVADRGKGVPREARARLFERFYQQGGTRETESGGLGLGLSIVSGFAKGMGGSVSVTDREGGGSVFAVALPAWTEEEGDAGNG